MGLESSTRERSGHSIDMRFLLPESPGWHRALPNIKNRLRCRATGVSLTPTTHEIVIYSTAPLASSGRGGADRDHFLDPRSARRELPALARRRARQRGVLWNLPNLCSAHRQSGFGRTSRFDSKLANGGIRRVLYVGKGALSGVTVARSRAGPRHGWKPVRVLAVRPRVSSALQPYLPYPNSCQGKEGVRR